MKARIICFLTVLDTTPHVGVESYNLNTFLSVPAQSSTNSPNNIRLIIIHSGFIDTDHLPANISSFHQSVHPHGLPTWGWIPLEKGRKGPRVTNVQVGDTFVKPMKSVTKPIRALTPDEEQQVLDLCQ